MTVTTCATLSKDQKTQADGLVRACQDSEPLTLTFPSEDADTFFLAFEDGALCCALSLADIGGSVYECSAFTHPSYRIRGYFSRLLKKALDSLPEDAQLAFPSDGKSGDAKMALAAIGAEFWYSEHLMELSAEALAADFSAAPAPARRPKLSFSDVTVSDFHDPELFSDVLVFESGAGCCRIALQNSCYYLYDLEIKAPLRGQGHGRALLIFVLSALAARKKKPVRLQVSGNNEAALSLYKKTGFQITETLSYFLY